MLVWLLGCKALLPFGLFLAGSCRLPQKCSWCPGVSRVGVSWWWLVCSDSYPIFFPRVAGTCKGSQVCPCPACFLPEVPCPACVFLCPDFLPLLLALCSPLALGHGASL